MAEPLIRRGMVIDGYEVFDLLGRGGMGAVYRVRRGDMELALKTLTLPATHDGSEEVVRFRREAELLATLRHPGIVRVVSAGHKPGFFYYVMRIVEGESLEDRIKRAGPLPTEQAVALVLQVADAIAHAHERGIVHRDLKPANVVLDADDRPLVMDFGLARRLGEAETDRLTKTGEVLGTPAYLAPEQAFGLKGELDEKTDIYGLGALLYALLAGRAPFEGPSALVIMKRVSTEPSPPLDDVPSELEAFVFRAMAKRREDRPASVRQFMAELEAASSAGGLSRVARALLGIALLSVIGLAVALAAARGPRKTKPDVAPLASAATAPATTRTIVATPRRPLTPEEKFAAALDEPTLAKRIQALHGLDTTPLPEDRLLRRRIAAVWLEQAKELNEQLRSALAQDHYYGNLMLAKKERMDTLAGAVRSLCRAIRVDDATPLMPEELSFSLELLEVLSRNDTKMYVMFRGADWAQRWAEGFADWPEHPTNLFIAGWSHRGTSEAYDEAHRARLALEKAPRAPATRLLAYLFVRDFVAAAPDRQPLLLYARYKEASSPEFAEGIPDPELIAPERLRPETFLGNH